MWQTTQSYKQCLCPGWYQLHAWHIWHFLMIRMNHLSLLMQQQMLVMWQRGAHMLYLSPKDDNEWIDLGHIIFGPEMGLGGCYCINRHGFIVVLSGKSTFWWDESTKTGMSYIHTQNHVQCHKNLNCFYNQMNPILMEL